MLNLICLDRDGTINRDDNFYLGSTSNWKDLIDFLPGVIEGIEKLNRIPNSEIFIITNQSGVALKGPLFDQLTTRRMNEVNKYILQELSKQGAHIRNYFACPFVDRAYVGRSRAGGREINPAFIFDNCPDLKPNTGLVKKAAGSLGKTLDECEIFVIGDRISDVQLGLNSGGHGILVESSKTRELRHVKKIKQLGIKMGNVYTAKNFLEAVNYVEWNAV